MTKKQNIFPDYVYDMWDRAKTARSNAYAPYSNFLVGACVRTESGDLFAGCNVENVMFHVAHAEYTAICNAISHGHKKITDILIVGGDDQLISPCGSCRQIIVEFCIQPCPIYLANQQNIVKKIQIKDLLPDAFDVHTLREA